MWNQFAETYVEALDERAAAARRGAGGSRRGPRSQDLSEWHALLSERLIGSDREGILDRLAPRAEFR